MFRSLNNDNKNETFVVNIIQVLYNSGVGVYGEIALVWKLAFWFDEENDVF